MATLVLTGWALALALVATRVSLRRELRWGSYTPAALPARYLTWGEVNVETADLQSRSYWCGR